MIHNFLVAHQLFFAILLLGTVGLGIIVWIIFYLFSVRRLEKEFKQRGIQRNDWDFMGARAFWYAGLLVYKQKGITDENHFFTPVAATRALATKKDYILAFLFEALLILSSILYALAYFFDFFDLFE